MSAYQNTDIRVLHDMLFSRRCCQWFGPGESLRGRHNVTSLTTWMCSASCSEFLATWVKNTKTPSYVNNTPYYMHYRHTTSYSTTDPTRRQHNRVKHPTLVPKLPCFSNLCAYCTAFFKSMRNFEVPSICCGYIWDKIWAPFTPPIMSTCLEHG